MPNKKAKDSAKELEKAKEKLRDSLGRLENIVDKKILDAKKAIPTEANSTIKDMLEVKNQLEEKTKELEYSREENRKLQARVGKIEDEHLSLMEVNDKISDRVTAIISELEEELGVAN